MIRCGPTWLRAMSTHDRPENIELHLLEEQLVNEMLSNNQYMGTQNAIAVASIVDMTDLNNTNRLGQQLSEGIDYYLHEHGFRVVDFKLTGTLQVRPGGDFVFSRDWRKLTNQQPIDYLVSGTMDEYKGGLNISIRMVDVRTKVVVGSAQAFIPHEEVMGVMSAPTHADANNGVEQAAMNALTKALPQQENARPRLDYTENGMLIRKQRPASDTLGQ